MQFANGLDFMEIAQQFLCREHQQVLFESSFNRLKQDCQDGSNWEEDSDSAPEPIRPTNRPSNPSESFDRPYAIYNNRFFDNKLEDVFKNRMNRLVYVPTTFDLALLLQHGVKQLFHFSLLEPSSSRPNLPNDANVDVIDQFREILNVKNDISINLKARPESNKINSQVHAFISKLYNGKRTHHESESTLSEEDYDEDYDDDFDDKANSSLLTENELKFGLKQSQQNSLPSKISHIAKCECRPKEIGFLNY